MKTKLDFTCIVLMIMFGTGIGLLIYRVPYAEHIVLITSYHLIHKLTEAR